MKINILSNSVPWFGKYSGYECLPNYFPAGHKLSITYPHSSKFIKGLGKGIDILYKRKFSGMGNGIVWRAYTFLNQAKRNDVSHILYGDGYLNFIKEFPNKKKNLVGTLHFPLSEWTPDNLDRLEHLPNAIILFKEEIPVFSKYMPAEKLKFIRHGVDIDFFAPGPEQKVNAKKLLFVGSFLRNIDMFFKVYDMINKEVANDYEYHIIMPKRNRTHPLLQKEHKNVFFHENLSDEELLWYYQTSYLLLMPMDDSGANTAIIQAIACGLPILTTDRGGIRSYGGGEVYPLVTNNDTVGMVELFNKYRSDRAYRDKIAADTRNFALEFLDWRKIAQEHINYYQQIAR
jgi:glycosyltransferase involved in cell wall biosynthesis